MTGCPPRPSPCPCDLNGDGSVTANEELAACGSCSINLQTCQLSAPTPTLPPTPTATALPGSVLSAAIGAVDPCIPVSDATIFSTGGGFAFIGTELISYTGVSASCSSTSVAEADGRIAAAAGVLTGVTRNLNGQGGAHAAGTAVTPTTAPSVCIGDCDGSGMVAVNELITLVNVALGSALPSACPHGIPSGGEVNISLLIEAVNSALNGCG